MTLTTDVAESPTGQAEGDAFEMANLRPKTTGLPFVVFVSQRGGATHDASVKVSANPRALPSEMISIPLRPEILIPPGALSRDEAHSLRAWIEKNLDALIDYWTGDIACTEDVLERLRPV